ncbi:MAG: hypothetical protein HN712_03970 [Gemmatimonadetes bacterium]|nr:hypothetical protein [Gemmatimonadota bacterium]
MRPYPKPWIEAPSRRGSPTPGYPYPRDLLRRCDIFPLLVLDGGAFFFTHEHLGGATASDFLAAYQDGSLLAPWRDGRGIDWDRALTETAASACPAPLEKHVWLQRLYFLLPLAQAYLRSGQERWARDWYRHLNSWLRHHPRPSGAEDRKDWAWFDMQVTWRLLVLVHSVPLLASSSYLTASRWRRVHRALVQHSEHVLEHATAALKQGTGRGNHFLQKGVALLYSGLLFSEEPGAEACRDTGRAIVRQQMETEIMPDGGSVEASPSYSHFIARLYLEAFLLLRDNGQSPIRGLDRSLRRQYRHLAAITSPQGRSLQVSDSYSLDAVADLRLVEQLFPLGRRAASSTLFPDSGMAVLRRGPFTAIVDAGGQDLWHHHQGRPNLLLFVEDQPLLVDSGCGNYDATLRVDYCKRAEAHNVVVVGAPAGAPHPTVSVESFEPHRIVVKSVQRAGRWHCTWTRTISLARDEVLINDRLSASKQIEARLLFHLAPMNVVLQAKEGRALAHLAGRDLSVSLCQSAEPFRMAYRPAFGPDNHLCVSPELTSEARGRRLRFSTRIGLG